MPETCSARAILVHPDFLSGRVRPHAQLEEAEKLAGVIGLHIVFRRIVPVPHVRPATLIGGGAVMALAEQIQRWEAEVAVVDAALSPVHQRNLEKAWHCKVLDRTALILEIFGARARTREGRLQVDLAALSFQKSRLVRSWTHLERQRGGAGFMGGPGERQIESDRRHIAAQISRLRARLDRVVRRRCLQRANRRRHEYPIIALVGYTNAGKSTLFNRLTGAHVEARDQLFSTLDPTMRSLRLPSGMHVVLFDTVGFIANLPTDLIAAFRATLEEVTMADLLVHVRDMSHPNRDTQFRDVMHTLSQLDITPGGDPPMLTLGNKADLLSDEDRARYQSWRATHLEQDNVGQAWHDTPEITVSCRTGEGIDTVLTALEARLLQGRTCLKLTIDVADSQLLAWIHRNGSVLHRNEMATKITLEAAFAAPALGRLRHRFSDRFVEGKQELHSSR